MLWRTPVTNDTDFSKSAIDGSKCSVLQLLTAWRFLREKRSDGSRDGKRCYRIAMKNKKAGPQSITAPLLRGAVETFRTNLSKTMPKLDPKPTVGASLEVPPELDQDAGSGYNDNRVFPQD